MTQAGSSDSQQTASLTSSVYHITVDDGRDAFFALSIERRDSETAWLMSDTVRALPEMR